MTLYPGSSLEATNRVAFGLENKLKNDPRFEYIQVRSGRAPSDPDAAPVNIAQREFDEINKRQVTR